MLLPDLLNDFVDFYFHISVDFQRGTAARTVNNTPELVIRRINSGDCGTAALAVGWAFVKLQEKAAAERVQSPALDSVAGELGATAVSDPVQYWDNYDHAYLGYNGLFYDTANPQGISDYTKLIGYRGDRVVQQLPRAEIWDRYIHIDAMGARIIELYCDRWGIERCALSSALLASSDDAKDSWFANWNNYARSELDYYMEHQAWRP